MITNSPDAVRRLATEVPSGLVRKSLGPSTVTEGGRFIVAYTHLLSESDLTDLSGVDATATQMQQWVAKTHEARVVVVGDRMFTILIHAGSDASRVDWRADYHALSYEWVDTPAEVEKGLRQYLTALGLAYAAVDFAIDRDGSWVFLEFTDRSDGCTWRSPEPVSGGLRDRLPTGFGTFVLFRGRDGACDADGAGRGSEGAGDQPRWGLAVVGGVVA